MDTYMSAFMQYVKNHPLKDGDAEMTSVLELFYNCFSESNLRDSKKAGDCFRRVDKITASLQLKESDALFDAICDLCIEKERTAFQEGFRAGGQWVWELMEKEKTKIDVPAQKMV